MRGIKKQSNKLAAAQKLFTGDVIQEKLLCRLPDHARRRRVGHLWQTLLYFICCNARETIPGPPLRHISDYLKKSLDQLIDWEFRGAERWIALLAKPEELTLIRSLQRSTFTTRPLGMPSLWLTWSKR